MTWCGSIPFKDLGMTEAKMVLLKELMENSDYWSRAYLFVHAITNRKLSSLSDYQRRWLTEITLALDTELDRKSWKIR